MVITFELPLKYTIKNVHENEERLELNGTHQILVYCWQY